MPETSMALLEERGVVAVTGADAGKLLQGLITSDLDRLKGVGDALHAGLLTPQGKILFAFFVVKAPDGFLLETGRDQAAALAKRLSFYKLRAAVRIEDVSSLWHVLVAAGDAAATPPQGAVVAGALAFADPRHAQLGLRVLIPSPSPGNADGARAYHAHRISLGVPDAGLDFPLGDTFPHEANFDLCHGVDFGKGCFVGQEVVARMQHKTVVRKRIVKVSAAAALPADHPDITAGAARIGRLGSVDGNRGLAMLRLDRAVEMIEKGEPIRAGAISLIIDGDALAAFRAAAKAEAGAP